jgi:hypothetical protein
MLLGAFSLLSLTTLHPSPGIIRASVLSRVGPGRRGCAALLGGAVTDEEACPLPERPHGTATGLRARLQLRDCPDKVVQLTSSCLLSEPLKLPTDSYPLWGVLSAHRWCQILHMVQGRDRLDYQIRQGRYGDIQGFPDLFPRLHEQSHRHQFLQELSRPVVALAHACGTCLTGQAVRVLRELGQDLGPAVRDGA